MAFNKKSTLLYGSIALFVQYLDPTLVLRLRGRIPKQQTIRWKHIDRAPEASREIRVSMEMAEGIHVVVNKLW
jgi:hypothetical protein